MKKTKKIKFNNVLFNLNDESVKCGRKESYFHVMQYANVEKWNFFETLAKTPSLAHNEYEKKTVEAQDRILSIIHKLSETRELAKFSMYLHRERMYPSQYGFRASMQSLTFSRHKQMNHSFYMKCNKIIKMYDEWK